jgi:hypothetical protein
MADQTQTGDSVSAGAGVRNATIDRGEAKWLMSPVCPTSALLESCLGCQSLDQTNEQTNKVGRRSVYGREPWKSTVWQRVDRRSNCVVI